MLAAWDAWTYLADPGTHAGEETWARRTAALLITFMGILFMATIIGFVSNTLLELIDEFRTGKSAVVEEDHTVLLGWTSSSVSLITEIIIANESEEGTIKGVIVVLANGGQKEKEEIEETAIEMAADAITEVEIEVETVEMPAIAGEMEIAVREGQRIMIQTLCPFLLVQGGKMDSMKVLSATF